MDLFSALGEPTRRNIVELLAIKGQLSAGDIGKRFACTPPTISQHLKVLREANLVRMEKRSQLRIYSINPIMLDEVEQWVSRLRAHWNARFDALEEVLKAEKKAKKQKHKGKKKNKKGKKS